MNTFKTQPMKHQTMVLEASWSREYYGLFLEQGLGKTKVILDTAAMLYQAQSIDRLLVLAPKGVHTNWVRIEIPKHLSVESNCLVWKTPPGVKLSERLHLMSTNPVPGRLNVLAMNTEAVRTETGFKVAMNFLKGGPGLMVVDESTSIKSHKAIQTKSCIILGGYAKYRRILTGTPIAHNPIDLYSQCKFLHKSALPVPTLTAFKAMFADEVIKNYGGRSFKQIVAFKNLNILGDWLSEFSVRVEKKDALDLPDKIYQTRFVEMSPEQSRIYKALKDDAMVQLEKGELTATSALTIMTKCRQIVQGFVYTDEGQFQHIPNNRVQILLDEVSQDEGKYVIWFPFIGSLVLIHEALEKAFPLTSVTFSGQSSNEDRYKAVTRFQNDPTCRFFLATSAGAQGLTLTAADRAIYYGNTLKMNEREQSEDRIHRIGQVNHCLYLDLVCENTVDERVTELFRAKKDVATMLTNNIRSLADLL